MMEGDLSIDDFFARLTALFKARNEDASTIFLTQKRFSPNGSQGLSALVADDEPSIAEKYEATADVADSGPFPVIMRATNGKGKAKRSEKIKIKTIVQPGEMDGFFSRYAELCKANMQGLKKRDKSKKKRAKRKKRNDGETEMSTG